MQRHREIAASPVRSASEVWEVLTQLLIDTATRSAHIGEVEVSAALAAAAPAGMMLIAAGHLERQPIVFVADTLQLSITTMSGDKAFAVEENLNPVPGAAEAAEWTLHLPTPEPVGDSIATLISGVDHLSSEPVTGGESTIREAAPSPAPALDLKALSERQAN